MVLGQWVSGCHSQIAQNEFHQYPIVYIIRAKVHKVLLCFLFLFVVKRFLYLL